MAKIGESKSKDPRIVRGKRTDRTQVTPQKTKPKVEKTLGEYTAEFLSKQKPLDAVGQKALNDAFESSLKDKPTIDVEDVAKKLGADPEKVVPMKSNFPFMPTVDEEVDKKIEAEFAKKPRKTKKLTKRKKPVAKSKSQSKRFTIQDVIDAPVLGKEENEDG